LQDINGETVLVNARKYGHADITDLLEEAGACCPGYERSGWFDSTCKRCGGSKVGRWHDDT